MIKFFVSSTFADMAAERDVLNQLVLPEIRSFVYDHSCEDVSLVDLRWGISTEELESNMGMKKIISTCMQEIDACTPHIIILLGNRYGSVPSDDVINEFLRDPASTEFSKNDLYGKSITEMEIIHYLSKIHGVEDQTAEIPIYVCVRDPLPYDRMTPENRPRFCSSQPEDIEKMQKLRQYLCERFPEHVIRYSADWDQQNQCVTGLEPFVEKLTVVLKNLLSRELPVCPPTDEERQMIADTDFEENLCRISALRPSYMRAIQDYIENGSNLILLSGVSGSGKSCITSHISRLLRKNSECKVISMHCGNSKYLFNCTDILRHLIWRLEESEGIDDHYCSHTNTYEQLKTKAHELLTCIGEKVIIIDGINMLQADIHRQTLDFIPVGHAEHCCFILSTSDEYTYPQALLELKNTETLHIDVITNDEIEPIIQQQLVGQHKQLPSYAIRAVREAAVYQTPLYLSMILNRVCMLDQTDYSEVTRMTAEYDNNGEESLYQYIKNMIQNLPSDIDELAWQILCTAASKQQFQQFEYFSALTSLAQLGFRTHDYVACSRNKAYEMNLLSITRYIHFLPFMFSIDSEDRVQFSHQVFERTAIKHTHDIIQQSLPDLLSYLGSLPDLDPVKILELINLFVVADRPALLDITIPTQYISSAYIDFENRVLLTGKNNTPDNWEVFSRIIKSIQNCYVDDNSKQEKVYSLLLDMCKAAANISVECLYGLISAILFSFDILGGAEVCRDLIDQLMECMHTSCIALLYPHAKNNPCYLRCVYVCCERCYMRATAYGDKDQYLNEFYSYALEMQNYDELPAGLLVQWKHDVSCLYSDLGSHFEQRNYRRAIDFFETAKQYLSDYCELVKDEPDKVLFAEASIHSINIDIANCLIQKVMLNKRIGFVTDPSTLEELDGSLIDLQKAGQFIEQHSTEEQRFLSQVSYWAVWDDYYRFTDNFDMQRLCVTKLIEFSKQEYSQTRHITALDKMRNAYLRIALAENCGYSLTERVNAAKESFRLTELVAKDFRSSPEMMEKIITVTLQTLIDLIAQQIAEINGAAQSVDTKQNRLADICIDLLNMAAGYIMYIFAGDNGNKAYLEILEILRLSSRLSTQFFDTAEHFAQKLTPAKYSEAVIKAETAYMLRKAIIPYAKDAGIYLNMIESANLCAYLFRQLRFHRDAVPKLANRKLQETYYTAMMYLYDKILFCKYSLVSLELHKTIDFNQYLDCNQIQIDNAETVAWLHFCEFCIQQDKMEDFWRMCDRIQYRMPGQKENYLFLLDKEFIFDDELPQVMAVVGRYFLKHLNEPNVLRLLAMSDIFEASTLEMAYRDARFDSAKIIIDNQYDYFLELPLLVIIRKHDRHEYIKRLHELKPLCISKRKKDVRDLSHVLTPDFCEEFLSIVRGRKS